MYRQHPRRVHRESPVSRVAEPQSAEQLVPSGTVAFLFTDIERSTRLWEEKPQAMAASLRRHDALVRGAVERHNGSIFSTGGDGFCVAFPTVGHAISSAIQIQRTLQRDVAEYEVALRVRMGVHAGSGEERDGDYFGPVLNRGARLMEAAHGGQIVVSALAAGLLSESPGPDVELTNLGLHRLRDLLTPEHVLQVVAADLPHEFPPLRSRRSGNIPRSHPTAVGRSQELAETAEALATARLVTVVGGPARSRPQVCLGAAQSAEMMFPGGAWYVELAHTDGGVVEALARALGFASDGPDAPGADVLRSLSEGLGSDPTLLVLLDPGIGGDAVANAVIDLLDHLGSTSILVSSPQALGIAGERPVLLRERELPADVRRLRATPLFGRQPVLTRLRETLAEAACGERRLVMVSGEEGMGKTRLVAEAAADVVGTDGLVLRGAWHEEGVSDFEAFRQAMAFHTSEVEPVLFRTRLDGLLPALTSLVPGDAVLDPAPGESDRFALLDAVDTWFARLASSQTVLLWLDDLQWADPSSLQMLLHLARSPRPAQLVIATTHQPAALTRDDDVSHILARLRRSPGFTHIDLSGLDTSAAQSLVSSTMTTALSPRALLRLHGWSGGNPLFLQELARLVDESHGGGSHRATIADLDEIGVPESVIEVVRWRLARRSARLSHVLSVAAVIGTTFDTQTLAAVLDASPDEVDRLIDEGCEAGFIDCPADAATHLAFHRDLVRQALYQDLPPRQRHRLHQRVLDVLLDNPNPDPAAVVRHLSFIAGPEDLDRTVEFATSAAARAARQMAYENAARHYDAAMRVLDRHPDIEAPRAELLIAAGEAYNKAGALDDGRNRLNRAAAEARRLGRTDLLARAGLAWGGVLPVAPPVDHEAVELLHTVVDHFPGDQPERARALVRQAEWLQREMSYSDRLALVDEAITIAERVGDPGVLGWVLNSGALALHAPDQASDMCSIAERVVELSRLANDDELAFEGWKLLLHGLFATGQMDSTREVATTVARLGRHLRQPEYLRVGHMWEANVATMEGRFNDARSSINDTLAVTLTGDHSQIADIQFMLRAARFGLQGTSPRVRSILDGLGIDGMRSFCAWYHAEAGHPDEVWPLLQTPDLVEEIGRRRWYMFWADIVGFGTAAALLGHTRLAGGLRELILPFREHNAVLGISAFLGTVTHHLGVLSAVLGDLDGAVADLQVAVDRHRAMDARPWVALSQIELARVLDARRAPGDLDRAAELTAEAVDTAKVLELGSVRRRVGRPIPTSPV
jgi:class 3 adenylate cyclase